MFFSIIGNILLFILKIILFLLLFILVIVGLVLLSPIRYNIFVIRNYEEQEGINARAKCLWLLGIIYIRFVYKDDKPDLAVRLFGIDLSKIKGLFLRLKSSKEKKENPKEKSTIHGRTHRRTSHRRAFPNRFPVRVSYRN